MINSCLNHWETDSYLMKPLYFGSEEKQLFGIHHTPANNLKRNCGIVLCHPMGQEYIRSHRAFRQLAILLAREGFPVLRFDYFGTGDSAGEHIEGNTQQWINDISTAILELKKISQMEKVCLVGLRLGAALAFLSANQLNHANYLVLWDPVINGKIYMEELKSRHQEWLRDTYPNKKTFNCYDNNSEILGFPLTGKIKKEFNEINLLACENQHIEKIFLISNERNSQQSKLLLKHIKDSNILMQYQHIDGAKIWLKHEGLDKTVVPAQILQSIISWISKNCL